MRKLSLAGEGTGQGHTVRKWWSLGGHSSPCLGEAEIQSFQPHCATSEKTIKPTTFPESLKFSSQTSLLQTSAGDTSSWKPPWISLPDSGPTVLRFLPQVHPGRAHRGPILAGQDSEWLNKGTVSETQPFLPGDTLYAAGGRAVGQPFPRNQS